MHKCVRELGRIGTLVSLAREPQVVLRTMGEDFQQEAGEGACGPLPAKQARWQRHVVGHGSMG